MLHRFQVKQVKRKKKQEREYLAGGRRDQSKVVQDVLADLKIISRRVERFFFPLLYVPKIMGYVLLVKALDKLRLVLKQNSLLGCPRNTLE